MYCCPAGSLAPAVFHGAEFFEGRAHTGDLAGLLADGDVDADHAGVALVDDGVDGNGGLADLAVADYELALAAADGDHGVDGADAGLQGGVDVGAQGHAGSDLFDDVGLVGLDGAVAVDRLTDGVDDAPQQGFADRHLGDAAGGADFVAFFDLLVGAEQHGADGVFFEVQGHAQHAAGELQ